MVLIGENIAWLKELRETARKHFSLPAQKTEAFKYLDVSKLDIENYIPQSKIQNLKSKINSPKGYIIAFTNGIFNPHQSHLPEEIEAVPLIEKFIEETCNCNSSSFPLDGGRPGWGCQINTHININQYPFAALNTAYLQEGVFINIDRNLDKPLVIVYQNNTEEKTLCTTRNIISLDVGVHAEILEIFAGSGNHLTNHVNEIFLKPKSKLNHYKLLSEQAKHIALSAVNVETDAAYNQVAFLNGDVFTRDETNVRLAESEAAANIYKAYFRGSIVSNIEHLAPNTNSDQLTKCVAEGKVKASFQGKISVARDAQKISGYMLHNALLLSDDAEVNCKPELEIFADDVKCSHGATVGSLDKNQLFYLQSRGISEADAKKLLTKAYLNEILEKIENEEIKEWFIQSSSSYPPLSSS